MIEKIEILQHSECRHLGFHSGEETAWLIRIVSYHHEMIIQLRKNGLNSLSEAFVCPCRRSPVLLVQPVWYIKCDVGVFKQIQLNRGTQVAFISKYHAVTVLPLHIFKILQVMHVGRSHVKGMDDTCNTTQSMELVAVIVHVLRCTIALGWCMLYVILPHPAPVGTCILADLYRLGVDTEDRLPTINLHGYGLADFLTEHHGLFAALIVLPTGNQVGNSTWAFNVEPVEKVVLTVNTECLCRYGKGNHLQVGECGDNTTTGNISILVYLISSKLFAYLKNFSELCNEVVHSNDDST